MSLFVELKRRNVFRVGIAYMIGAWLLAQIADLLIDNIGAPDWVMKTLFVVLGLGFFIALFFAWAFEMTPDGVKRESEIDRSQSITKTTGSKLDRSIIVILVIALGYFAWDKFSSPVQPVSTAATEQAVIEKSIAVLPFVNMSADKDNEYFSDGLSEELLNLLAKVDGLKVAARTSSFKFRNSDADISEIGAQLNVATVLEGSVRKSGNHARITAQLIKVDDGFHLWSETYDRELDNIFEVQDEIATAIVEALKLPLLGHDAQPLTATSADNYAAYDLYLQGRHHARRYSEEDFERAKEYYLASLEIDPSFAPALSGLADVYIYLADFGDLPKGEAQKLASDAAEKALSINPDAPEAHASMGLILNGQGRYQESEAHLLKALQINPNYVDALLWYRSTLASQLRNAEGMEMVNRAMNVDPLSPKVRRHYANQLTLMLRFDDAITEIQSLIAANPDNPTPYEPWGDLFLQMGLPQKAIPMHRNAHRLRPGDIYMASKNVGAGLQLDDMDLVAFWLQEARDRGVDAQWTRSAENEAMYATGSFPDLLRQVDEMLESQPRGILLLIYRNAALMRMGEIDAAKDTMQLALDSSGYVHGQDLTGDQMFVALQLANILDQSGDTKQRDWLVAQVSSLVEEMQLREPRDKLALYLAASVASIRNDLPGTLSKLGSAAENGYREHWQLVRNPVFERWQQNEEFMAFYQGMLKTAADMRHEYELNNPTEKPAQSVPGFN
jgi:TolB-like protein